jgi:hypothetical protein
LHYDYGPTPQSVHWFDVREALGDVAHQQGMQEVAGVIRKALRAIGIEPAAGESSTLAKRSLEVLKRLDARSYDEWFSDHVASRDRDPSSVAPDCASDKATARSAPRVKPGNGLVSRAVLANKLGVSYERVRQLIKTGQISETPNGIDLEKAIGQYALNVDQARVAANRSRVDRKKKPHAIDA